MVEVECLNVKETYILIVNGMYMRRFVLFWFKEHLDDNSIKSNNLWHNSFVFIFTAQRYAEYL